MNLDRIQITLLRLKDGARLLRLTESETGFGIGTSPESKSPSVETETDAEGTV
jgi:hypothetical protein